MLPEILHYPILVSTTIGDDIRAKKVYKNCAIKVLIIVIRADLVELAILHFDIILGIDWVHKCYATIDYRNTVVRLHFHKKYRWNGKGMVQIQ